ncbi:PREDICTED: uncharacterized protein At4g10930-like isoform X2 [Camelina sativa]|nr:PREDICTED: uncharacterized protein At4g10930-like isoform X2 [Camelina sativa]
MELDFDASNLVEDEAAEVGQNDMAGIEGERCGICMDIIIDRGVLDCCQHWFCFECIDNWSTIMNLCPLCQREFQLITCVPVYDSGEGSKVDEVSVSGDEDYCIEEETDAVASPSHYIDETHYIDENAVICLDGDLCKIRNTFSYIEGDSNLDTSIACDSCDIWYHAVCVGFDLEVASEDTWVCPRCLSNEKPLEPDISPMETQPDTSPTETRKSLDISERTNSGCSAEAIYSGNFSVTVADEGETALVVSIVKGDECHMESSDTNPSSVQATNDGDPDSSHLKILCGEENTEQVPVKLELKQSLPHDISSRLFSDSDQPCFAAPMENRTEPVEEKDSLLMNDQKNLSTSAISNSDVASVISLKRKHSDFSGDDGNSETKPEISESLNEPKLEEEEDLATVHQESRSPSNNTTVDIFSIVKGTGRRKNLMRSNPADKSSEGENAAGLRVKKIKRTPEDEKESMILVEKLRKEIREAVRNKSMDDITTNQFDPKLLAAFRAAVAGPKTDEAPRKNSALAVKAKKLMLQKGKVRENLTKKIYADLNGKRKSAWHRDCEVEFWKHRCIQTRKPEKIETLKSVLSLLKKKPAGVKTSFSSETPQASNPILSRLYLADTSVFPRNDNLKPLLAPKETGNSQNNAKPTEVSKTIPKISDAKGSSIKPGSKLNLGNRQSDGQPNLTSSNSKEMFENPDGLKKDKRKWALQVLARKKALAGNNSTEEKEGSPELKGSYPLLAQLPADMRPSLATSRHNKVPVAVRQTQLYRLTEHFLKKENLPSVRRSAATELAVADAINIEKAIADKSSSKVVYLNLCSQEILHHSESKVMDNSVEPNSSSPMAVNESELISGKDSDDPAVLQALRAAGLADSPPNSPTRSTEVLPEKGDSSLDKTREAVPYNVLDMNSVPDTDIFGDFEYELDEEDYIGATMATKASVSQPDESLTKVKVVFSTVQPEKCSNQSEVLGNEETTVNEKGTTNGEEDGKSFVPIEPLPEVEAEGEGEGEGEGEVGGVEILSVAECEELYGPGTEKLVEKPLIEGSGDNGVQAKVPDSECESNTHREIIASNFGKTSIQEKKVPKSIQKCNPSEKPSKEEKTSEKPSKEEKTSEKPSKEEKSKADAFSNSVTKKVEAYIKEHIRPLCKSGVINVEQYRWAVTKTTEKVMKYHSKAKSANFLIKEGDKIKKLSEQYVEAASSGAHHKDKCK